MCTKQLLVFVTNHLWLLARPHLLFCKKDSEMSSWNRADNTEIFNLEMFLTRHALKKHMFPKNKTFWDFHHLLRSFKGYLLVGKFVNLPIVNPFMSFMALYEGHVKTKVMASFTSFHLCVCFGF